MFPDLSQEKGEREGEEVGERQREQVRVVGGSSPAKKKKKICGFSSFQGWNSVYSSTFSLEYQK